MALRDNETKNQGEGDREAAKRYDQATLDFVESGKVAAAAQAAKPANPREAAEMLAAEREGLSHSKGEALADRGSTLPERDSARGPAPGTAPA